MHTKHKIYNRTTQRKQKKTHIQYCLWTVMATDTTRRRWQNRRVWRKNSGVQAPHNIFMNISSRTGSSQFWKSSTHDRTSVPDSYHRYSNSGKLLTTAACTRVAACDSNYSETKLHRVYTARCLDINCSHAARRTCSLHHVTQGNRTSRPWHFDSEIWTYYKSCYKCYGVPPFAKDAPAYK